MSAIGDKIKDATQGASSNRIGAKITSKHYEQTQRVLNNIQKEASENKYNFTPEDATNLKNTLNSRLQRINDKGLSEERIQEIKEASPILNPEKYHKEVDAGYYGRKAAEGFARAGEGIVDTAKILFGGEKNALEAVRETPSANYGKMTDFIYNNASGGHKLAGEVLSSTTAMAPTVAANLALPGLGYGVLGAQAFGSGTQQAYQTTGELGAKEKIYGLLGGLVEVGIEKLSGGIGGLGNGAIDDIASKLIKNGLIRSATGEGIEEAVTTIIDPYLQRLTYDKGAEGAKLSEVLRSAIVGSLTSMLLQGGSAAINLPQTIQQNKQNRAELRNSLEGIEKILPTYESQAETATSQENVARELPTMASQQAMLPTNRVGAGMAQTGNMEQTSDMSKMPENFMKDRPIYEVEIEKILPYMDDRMGGRENWQIEELRKDIKENGIDNPIELVTNSKGEIRINDGHHRLQIAKELGIKNIPVRYLDENSQKTIEADDFKEYNTPIDERWGSDADGIGRNVSGQNQGSGIAEENGAHTGTLSDRTNTTAENDKLYREIQAFDNRPSSDTTRRENIRGQEINTQADTQSAFSMPKNDVQTFASSESSKPYMDLDRYASRDNESQVNKVGLTDIQNAINDIVTVKTGKFRQNAYGIYKTKGEIIRLKQMKDIPVALHELTHHLDKMYNLSSSDKAFNELKKIAVVGKNATNQTIINEGVAEFGRYYMTDKEYAKEIAPFYYDAFERALDSDPAMKSKVENIRQMVTNYLDQSPLNRLSSNIDYGDEDVSLWKKGKDTLIKTANNFRKNFVDDLDPLKKIVNEISGDKKLMAEQDAYKLLRLNNGVTGKVQVALEYGVLNGKGEKVSKSLKEILEPVSNNQKEFVAYLTALRANDLQNRGIESGMLSRDIADVIKMYKGNETFNNAAKELYNFQNKILETTLIDSGIITKDALDAYNKNNPHYVPFYRVMDENFKQSKSTKSKKPTKIKGSTRDIINPLESIIKNTYSYMQMAERNDTFKVLFDMANKYDGTGKWFDKVPTDMMATKVTAEDVKGILEQLNLGDEDVNYNEIFTTLFKPANNQKGNIVTVMQKGKPVHYEIMDKELFDILSPEIKGENIIVKLLSPASKALRVGATHTPEFVLRNPLRDTMDAGIYSKNGFIPFVDTIRGLFDVAGRSDLYYKWLQSGGSGSTYTNAQRPVLQKTLKGLTQGTTNEKAIKTALNRAVELVKHPLRTYLDVAGTISNVAEEATRVGEFKRALEKGKSEKAAALDSREITLDFSRGGKVAKDINKVVAFFNAELQGLDKMFTSFKDRPLATTIKGIAYLTIPAMILRALQDEEELEKVPQWEKDEFFIVFAGDTPIKIPKPQGLGQLFATFPERIVDFIRTQDKDAFDGLVQRLVTSYVPIDSTTAIFPNLFLPLIENSANYSFFKQQPIVKQSLQNRSPKYQYDENTSTIAKSIGNIFNVSPKKVDNLISGYFGNLGKDVANLAGKPIELFNGDKKENEYKSFNSKLKQIPLVKGFVASDYASKTLDKFYEDKTNANTQYTDAKFRSSEKKMTYAEQKELQYYKDLNSIYTSAYNDIKDVDEQIDKVTNGTGTDKYKELRIEQLRKQKDKIAETAEGDAKKLKAKNKLITEAEKKNKLFGK